MEPWVKTLQRRPFEPRIPGSPPACLHIPHPDGGPEARDLHPQKRFLGGALRGFYQDFRIILTRLAWGGSEIGTYPKP